MLFFKKKVKVSECGLFDGYTDWHCHILPGVDDGVKDMDESLKILADYEAAGVRAVWLTPHIMEDIPNTLSELQTRYEELKSAYQGPISLRLAAENMLDSLFEQRLFDNELLPIDGNDLLVETSYFNPPIDLFGLLEKIKSAGYFPILAHPERYMYMGKKEYQRLKDMGVMFQLNLFSLSGRYGGIAKQKAESILKEGWYNFSGTDLHRREAFTSFLESELDQKTVDRLGVLLGR